MDTPVYCPPCDRGNKYPKKTIGELKVGDFIYGIDGKLTEVLHLNPIIFEDVYEVEFEDGEIVRCNSEHLWGVYDKYFKQRAENKELCERSTDFLYYNFKLNSNGKIEYRFHVPCCEPIQYPKIQHLPIDPYLLGLWLGDGSHSDNSITIHQDDADEVVTYLQELGNIVTKRKVPNKDMYVIRFNRKKDFEDLGFNKRVAEQKSFMSKIKNLDLYKNKHIPERYLYGTVEERLELLRGLMDSDGHSDKDGHCEITQAEYHLTLIEDISKLLSSLGIKNNIHYKKSTLNEKFFDAYRINFRTDKQKSCFKLKRKYNRLPDLLNGVTKTKAIVDVRKTGEKKAMRCITVSNDSGLFLCGEKKTATHNSYLSAPYMMARTILIPNHHTYIMCPAGNQAQETFTKMEDLAKGHIQSISGSTKVFWDELVKINKGSDGFNHDKTSYSCEAYNGSSINTLNSNPKTIVGIRSNLNFYDEAGKVDREFFALTKPFCTQDTNFVTGKNLNVECYPRQLPNQIIYSSSAESIDSELYDQYKDCALSMIAGSSEHFACDISCELSLHPFLDGKPYRPLLDQAVVDDAFKKNEFRANREYFNKFDHSGGLDALVKRTTIISNSYAYEPIYKNEDGTKMYLIAYDPASKLDNSFVLIAELFRDKEKGWMVKIVNAINLIEIADNGDKKVIQKPEQIERIKQLLLDYNGSKPDYDNIQRLIIDAGSGGGGFDIAQFLLKDWVGTDKRKHLGLIDMEDKYMKEERNKFPGAVDKLTLANFTADKVRMYTACQDMINQGLVMFPKSLNLRSEMEYEEYDKDNNLIVRMVQMNADEIKTLTEVDLLKEELVGMQKTQIGSNIRFDTLPSKKAQGMHDDRSDCCAMICFALAQIRQKDLLHVNRENEGFAKLFAHGKKHRQKYNRMSPDSNNPFATNQSNPFLN